MIHISQLFSTPDLLRIMNHYPVGLEAISFSIGSVLDAVDESIEHYKEEFKDISLPMMFHGPFLDLNPGTCDKRVMELVNDRFYNCAHAAKVFGVKGIVFHSGFTPNTYPEKYWVENVVDFWKSFLERTDFDGYIYIENVLDTEPQMIKEIIDGINHTRCKACLDIGHVNTYSMVSVEKWIHTLGERIEHVHIHNNDGMKDEHRGLLNGKMNMLKVMDEIMAVTNSKHFTLEVNKENELIESIHWLQANKYL